MSETKTLEQIRGSCAEVCAYAVKNLFPTSLLLGGGTTDYGFYYDFAIENQNVDQKAIDLITDEMFKIIDSEAEIEASEMLATNAVDFFLHKAQPLVSKQLEFSETDLVGIVRIGDFYDITSSSIVTDIKDLKNFKLQQIDHITEEYEGLGELQVTRITGTACITGRDLKHFLKGLESSKKHGHETLGKEMELFEFNDTHECTWFPNGVALRNLLKEWLSKENEAQSYFRVKSSSTVPSHIAASHLSLFTKKFDQEYSLPIRTTEIFDDTREIKKISYQGTMALHQLHLRYSIQFLHEITSSQ
jgi:threonyl-tRNA synthetase